MPEPSALRLAGVEVRRLDLSLRRRVGTSTGPHDRRPVLLVRLVTDGPEGWGECGALEHPGTVDPGVAAVHDALVGRAVGRLFDATRARLGLLPPASVIARIAGDDRADKQAGAALEMAVLDAQLRDRDTSLAAWLGATREEVEAGALVGIPPPGPAGTPDPRAFAASVTEVVQAGYRRVRIKIAPGWDAEPVRLARELAGPDALLLADANGAYRLDAEGPDGARALSALDPYRLVCVEQPLPPGDLAAHAELARRIATPVGLDESLSSPRRVVDALRYGACSVACLKPARLGGVAAVRRAQGLCADAGVPAFVGGFFETGLGRSANAALGALAGFTLPGDLSAPSEYLDADPFTYPTVLAGRVAVPTGPGVGSVPRPGVIDQRTTETRWFSLR
ncbi:MAG TPA: enolase C-terminal domain-like protein [Acidimicrobiales bacterium]|nr:enolase C-terminal domain-like protein [Acidimicrobiales bacterium]